MSDGQDLDVFIKEIYQLRDDLVEMGEVINDDSLLDIDSEGLTDDIFRSSTTPKILRYKPKSGEIPNGKAAWDCMIAKYQNSTRQWSRILKNQLVSMVMSDGQDLDVFIKEIYQLRDDLVEMGEVINDDSLLCLLYTSPSPRD